MDRQQLETWAVAYIDAYRTVSQSVKDELWWAIEKSMMLVTRECPPEDIWEFILEVLKRSPPPKVIEVLAAGPLEDLLGYAGDQYIDAIEVEARNNPAFRDLLGGVWQNRMSQEVWARVELVRGARW